MKKTIVLAIAALTVALGAFGVKAIAGKSQANPCCVQGASCCPNSACCE